MNSDQRPTDIVNQESTHIACLTPAGSGAIAVLALWGPNAWDVVLPFIQGRAPEPDQELILAKLGRDVADQVIILRRPARHQVEIHCHGGPGVVKWLLSLFCDQDIIRSDWQSYLRSFSNSPIQAEAAIALAHAPTLKCAGVLLDQCDGVLDRSLAKARNALDMGRKDVAIQRLDGLLKYEQLGRHLVEPWRVMIAGPPNVGKSSLLNAIVGYQRSIVSTIPGTTRDVVSARTAINGWPVEFLDTAGRRDAEDELEKEGIQMASSVKADLYLWVESADRQPFSEPPDELSPIIRVINKIDLAPPAFRQGDPTVQTSAQSGRGVPELLTRIIGEIVPEDPPPGAAVPFTDETVRVCRELMK